MIVFHASTFFIFGKLALVPAHVSDTSRTSIRKKVTSRPLFGKSGRTEAHIEVASPFKLQHVSLGTLRKVFPTLASKLDFLDLQHG